MNHALHVFVFLLSLSTAAADVAPQAQAAYVEAQALLSAGLKDDAAAHVTGGLALWLTAAEPPPFFFVGVGPMTGGGLLSVPGSF